MVDQNRPDPFHTKYRPVNWKEISGQKSAVKAMAGMISRRGSQAFLLIGPSGVGKTTMARIAAAELGASPGDIMEVDAATNTGVDAMRVIKNAALYKPFGSEVRCVIIDECHRLSGQAIDALLKATEEPPAHLYWFFCTTNAGKITTTLKTRCTQITLRSLSKDDLGGLFDFVCEEERLEYPEDVANLIIREANGSPRQLLVNMETCRDVTAKREAAQLLQTVMEDSAVIDLCRFLFRPGSWVSAAKLVNALEDENSEGVRIIVQNYFAKVARSAKNEKEAVVALNIMEQFSQPYNPSEGTAPILRSIGRVMF